MRNVSERLATLRHSLKSRPWLSTAAMVAAAFLVRAASQPLLGGAIAYSAFYAAVILAAYFFGRWPAIAAACVSAVLGFWCFVEPAYAWKSSPSITASFLLFASTSAVAILVISGLRGALRQMSRDLGRAQAVADSHAGLFRELNERMSHHMRLVAGVLALQAKGEPEPEVADSLRRAMERSLLIARVHREMGGRAGESVEFDPFATALARAVCAAREQPTDRVTIEASGQSLSVEDSASMGMALAECLSTLFDVGVAGRLSVRLDARGPSTEVAISEAAGTGDGTLVSVGNGYLLRAMTEQLGAAVALRADAGGSALVISLPKGGVAASAALAATFH